jgi:hypothetical protein
MTHSSILLIYRPANEMMQTSSLGPTTDLSGFLHFDGQAGINTSSNGQSAGGYAAWLHNGHASSDSPDEITQQLLFDLNQTVPDVGRLFDGSLGTFDWTWQ